MIRVILYSLIFLAALFATGTVIYLNQSSVSFVPWWSKEALELPLGGIVILCFVLGIAAAGVIGLFFNFRRDLKFRSLNKQLEREKKSQKQEIEAREYLAAGNLNQAEQGFLNIVERAPQSITARIGLVQTYKKMGDYPKALETVDESRATQEENTELLFLAAELNSCLGSSTAAYDNMALVLKHDPKNIAALRSMVNYCKSLGRWSEAAGHQERIAKLVESSLYEDEQEELAEIEVWEVENKNNISAGEKLDLLNSVLKKHKQCSLAHAKVADTHLEQNNTKAANKALLKAFKFSSNPEYLEKIARIWLKLEEPEQALISVRRALEEVKGKQDGEKLYPGAIFLVRLLLHLEIIEEADAELKNLKNLAMNGDSGPLNSAQQKQVDILEAAIMKRRGLYSDAVEVLEPYAEGAVLLEDRKLFQAVDRLKALPGGESKSAKKIEHQPSPELSTP